MGFKRTSEGRVFFKGADNDDRPATSDSTPSSGESSVGIDQTQMQILMLLKALNTKIKNTKDDRTAIKKQLAGYQKTITELDAQAKEHQKNYIDLEQKVAQKQNETIKKTTRVEDKVKETLEQLKEARKLVEELEKKHDGYDGSLETLKAEIETRKAEDEKISKRQVELEKKQKEQGEKMVDNVAVYVALTKRMGDAEARHESLDNKIEDVSSEYLKLDRKIEKALEDRTRILRKIERIENAVLETRDALNAKAMVLLTQQGAVAGIDLPELDDGVLKADPVQINRRLQEETMMPVWQKPLRINALTLGLLIIIAALFGWIISQSTSSKNRNDVQDIQTPAVVMGQNNLDLGGIEPSSQKTEEELAQDVLQTAPPVTEDTLQVAQVEQDNDATDVVEKILSAEDNHEGITIHRGKDLEDFQSEKKNIDVNNEAEMLKAMDENPEALAAALNEIEPSSATATQKVIDVKPQEKPEITPAAKSRLIDRIKPDPNLPEVAKKIEKQAFDGVPEAQHDMGAIYVSGHGQVKKDLARAVLWFQEAADNGVANAKYNLGVLYHQGLGVEKNIDKAMELYEQAATLGHAEAQYNLGIAYIEGIGVPYNPQKAAHYFEQSANRGVMEAAYNLGLIYENGLLGETKPDIALMWYKNAADKGSPEAKAALEQLASSLGIALSDVNRVVENVKLATKANPGGWSDGENPNNTPQYHHLIAQIQQELTRRGLYSGPIDGKTGPKTTNAIEDFQTSENLKADGLASQDLLNRLKSETPRSQYKPPKQSEN